MNGEDGPWHAAGLLVDELKSYVARAAGVPIYEVRRHIESRIADRGYKVLFPVNINPGKILSHSTPDTCSQEVMGDAAMTTVDFGFYDSQVMIDTAITLPQPSQVQELTLYRAALHQVVDRLRHQYATQGRLSRSYITRCVQQVVGEKWNIVEECGAHSMVVQPAQLHKEIIPMGHRKYGLAPQVWFEKGSVITLEPHVTPFSGKKYRVRYVPGKIAKDAQGPAYHVGAGDEPRVHQIHLATGKGWYEEVDLRLGDKEGQPHLYVIGLGDRTASY